MGDNRIPITAIALAIFLLALAILSFSLCTEIAVFGPVVIFIGLPIVYVWVLLVPYLQVPKNERDEDWRKEMRIIRIANVIYVVAIILYILSIKKILS